MYSTTYAIEEDRPYLILNYFTQNRNRSLDVDVEEGGVF